ncbi:hypothetical protein GCM10007216_08700 [Thalassobacillus devorans]|uniref:Uncharacterized protein n=1 Tax=Thalassobacillus devorans TaxID=279813 RepID=A0ABQ1NPD9_9BACI|nr:hypothetical protein GCM10007216_08700 [Thalassobacillus devorans]
MIVKSLAKIAVVVKNVSDAVGIVINSCRFDYTDGKNIVASDRIHMI